jgi:hypothetical protein
MVYLDCGRRTTQLMRDSLGGRGHCDGKDMSAPLIYEFHIDPTETVRASRVVQRRQRFAWITWAVWPLFAALAVFYLATGTPWQDLWLLGVAASFLLALQLLAPRLQRWQLRRAYAETPNLRGPQVHQFSDSGLSITGGSAATTLGWDSFVEVTEVNDLFLFFYSKKGAYYLPKRVVGGEVERRALRKFLRGRLGPRAAGIRSDEPGLAPA